MVARKIFFVILLGTIVSLIFYWFYKDFKEPDTFEIDTLSAVPQSAALIFESDNVTDAWRDLTAKSRVWEELLATDYFYRLNEIGEGLDSLMRNDAELREVLSEKPIAISAHMTGGQDFGFLFIVQLEKGTNFSEIHESIRETFHTTAIESRVYDGQNINSFNSPFFDGRIFYYIKGPLLVFSLAEVLTEESVRALKRDASVLAKEEFVQVRKTIDREIGVHAYLNYEQFKPLLTPHLSENTSEMDFFMQPFAEWSALDVAIKEEAFELNGFVAVNDSSKAWLDAFASVKAPEVNLLRYLPVNMAYFAFYGYGEYSVYREEELKKLEKNGNLYNTETALKAMDESCSCDMQELGVSWVNSQAVAFITEPSSEDYSQNIFALFETEDSEEAEETLRTLAEKVKTPDTQNDSDIFRLMIGDFYGLTLGSAFAGLENPYVVRHDDVIVMANSENALRNYLAQLEENRVFTETDEYEEISDILFKDVHFLFYSSMAKSPEILKNLMDEKYVEDIEGQVEMLRSFRSFIYQVSHSSGDLFYNSLYLRQGSEYRKETGAIWEVKLKAPARGKTHLVKNHYTGVLETLVQDKNDRIYLISNNGKIIWETSLDGPILGDVKQVDVYKNRKLQMLFNTPSTIYLLDRNGNAVESFPIKLDFEASAEVSVADYDNSRDYRFFIPTVNEDILCFDAQGNAVPGWDYPGDLGELIIPVEHIRIQRKDYLFTLTSGGRILLLNRRGELRHEVMQMAYNYYEGGYELEKGENIQTSSFYYADSSGTVYRLGFDEGFEQLAPRPQSQRDYFFGHIKSEDAMDFCMLYPNSLVGFSFDGEVLFETALPESGYDKTGIHQFGKLTAISALNTDKNELSLLTVNGLQVPGFPVYGSSIPSIGDLNKDGFPDLVTTGKEGFVYAYSIELE
jgi:hypothetical protein